MIEGIRSSRLGGIALAMAILGGAAPPAFAGASYGQPGVFIGLSADGSGRAYGTLGGTRNSADVSERISCFVARTETTSGTRSTSITCTARDTTRRSVSCTSTSAAVALGFNGSMSDGLIEFVWDAAGKCTNIIAYESSSLERKR